MGDLNGVMMQFFHWYTRTTGACGRRPRSGRPSSAGGQRHRVTLPSHRWLIDKFLHARKHYAHGPQYDYFDHWNRVGWTRLGDEAHPKAMAVLLSDAQEGTKWMEVEKPGARFTDLTEHVKEPVTANGHGWGEFRCNGGSVSVWVQD